METKYRIGYIDEEIEQFNKYERRFRKYGFEVIGYEFRSKMSLEDLMKQVYESDIDLLVIDYTLKDSNKVAFNGGAIERELYDKKPLFPYIIFTNNIDEANTGVEDWKIMFSKDDFPLDDKEEEDKEKVQHFITMLERSIEQYKKHIRKKKDVISELLVKGEKEDLDSSEQETLLSLQTELRVLDKTKPKEIPEKLISLEKLEDLSETRKEAEEFLESLIQKNKKK